MPELKQTISLTGNLYILAHAPTVLSHEYERARNIINVAEDSTNHLTDFYMWLDQNGKVVWISNMNQTTYQKYKGFDLSYRPYFNVARDTHSVYYSSTIESNALKWALCCIKTYSPKGLSLNEQGLFTIQNHNTSG